MSDNLEFNVDTSPLARAVRALEQVDTAAAQAAKGAGRFVDAAGKLREANGRFVKTTDDAARGLTNQATATDRARGATEGMERAMAKLKGAVAGYFTVQTALQVIREADAWQAARARLTLYAGTAENAAKLQQRLAGVALQTGQNVGVLTQSYTRLAQSARELGATQGQLLAVTQGVANAFRAGGTEGANATAAAQQLAQALGSGTLAGDELKSILENSGRLAQAIADGLGVSVGNLKKLGAEGELTSRAVFLALLSQTKKLADETAKLPLTVAQGWQNMLTAGTVAVARLDDAIGGTRFLARLLDGTAKGLLAAFAPDAFLQERGRQDVLGNRALSATGAARGFNTARGLIGLNNAGIAQILASNPSLQAETRADGRVVYSLPGIRARAGMSTDELKRARAGLATIERLQRENAMQQGRVSGFEERFAQGLAIPQDAISRAIAAERGKGGAATAAEKAAKEAAKEAAAAAKRYADTLAMARNGAQLGTFDERLGFRGDVSPFDARLGRARALVAGIPTMDTGGMADRVRAIMAPMIEVIEQAKERADELRRVFTEQLARGVQDGLAQPIAQFLRTWQLNVRSMGEALRDALVNAVSAALANAVMRKLFELFERLKQAGKASETSQLVNAATSLAAGFGGMGGGLSIPGMPRLGGAGGAGGVGVKAPPTTIGIPGLKGLGTIGVKTAAGVGIGGLALGGILGRRFGTGAGVGGGILGGVAAGAAFGGPVGAIIGGVAGAIGGFFGGRAKRQADRAREAASRSLLEDLGIRNAAAAGNDSEAARLRLLAQQRDELKAISDRFGARSKEVERLRQTQAAELRALTDSVLGPGVYMGPAGFNPAQARFDAGRPVTFTGPVTVAVPEGTTAEQARAILDEFGRMASAQGLPPSSWSQIQVQ